MPRPIRSVPLPPEPTEEEEQYGGMKPDEFMGISSKRKYCGVALRKKKESCELLRYQDCMVCISDVITKLHHNKTNKRHL